MNQSKQFRQALRRRTSCPCDRKTGRNGSSDIRQRRSSKGLTLVEGVSAIALFIPLIALSGFVIIEATKAFEISGDLQVGAGLAARALASSGGSTTPEQQALILQNVTVGDTLVDPTQFYNVQWNKTDQPPTVTVFVQYTSTGAKQPRPFPSPDPLKLGGQFVMKSQATWRLRS